MITTQLGYLGVEFNEAVNNETRGADALISTENSKVKVAVVTTDEELVIARDTMRLTTK
jgi:acetate kinase